MGRILSYKQTEPGIIECRIDLQQLFLDLEGRNRFDRLWPEFHQDDEDTFRIYSISGRHTLTYRSEVLLPTKVDTRPPLLLLLGNPASHSVAAGMFFAWQGKDRRREHRFWSVLREVGLLDLGLDAPTASTGWTEHLRAKRQALLNADYASPFRIGLCTYFSMPSPASDPKWSGVSGLKRLVGGQPFQRLAIEERQRVGRIIDSFMQTGGAVLVFQRDAYEFVRADDGPLYRREAAAAGQLHALYERNPRVHVYCAPPTRNMQGAKAKSAIAQYKEQMGEALGVTKQ